MRISSSLDPLMARSIQEILAAILLERQEPWYLSDLAKRLGRTPSTLQKPLESLVDAGILRRWSDGNRVYFARDPDCPFLPELQGLLAKTAGLAEVLRAELARFAKKIRVAFVYGSVAAGKERSGSDIDLMLIGGATLGDLTPALERVEKRLGRPVNATILPPQEFSMKLFNRNHFLHSLLAAEKIFIAGSEHELEELTRPGQGRSAHHKQGGAGRSARRG